MLFCKHQSRMVSELDFCSLIILAHLARLVWLSFSDGCMIIPPLVQIVRIVQNVQRPQNHLELLSHQIMLE